MEHLVWARHPLCFSLNSSTILNHRLYKPNTSCLTDYVWNKMNMYMTCFFFFAWTVALKWQDGNCILFQSDWAAGSVYPTDPAWGNLALQVSPCEEGPRSYLAHVCKCVLLQKINTESGSGIFFSFIQLLSSIRIFQCYCKDWANYHNCWSSTPTVKSLSEQVTVKCLLMSWEWVEGQKDVTDGHLHSVFVQCQKFA